MFGVSSTYIHQRSGQILVIQKVQKYHQHIFYNPPIPSILSHHAENWLNECSIELTASFYRRCVGDIFVLFESPESSHSFREYICSEHQHINLTVEHENILSFSFLDVKIFCENGKFVTSVYRKPTFRWAFTSYESFIPTYQQRGLLYT